MEAMTRVGIELLGQLKIKDTKNQWQRNTNVGAVVLFDDAKENSRQLRNKSGIIFPLSKKKRRKVFQRNEKFINSMHDISPALNSWHWKVKEVNCKEPSFFFHHISAVHWCWKCITMDSVEKWVHSCKVDCLYSLVHSCAMLSFVQRLVPSCNAGCLYSLVNLVYYV